MIVLLQFLALKRGDLNFSIYSPLGGTPEATLMAKAQEPIKIELVCFSGILCKARVMSPLYPSTLTAVGLPELSLGLDCCLGRYP